MIRMKNLPIELDYEEIKEFCSDYGIRRMALFGSVLTDKFNENSDIDFLIEYEDKHPNPSYQCHVRMDLEEMTGRRVDVVTVQALQAKTRMPWARDEILATAEDYYVA